MAKRVVGVALSEPQLQRLDELAMREGASRSAMVGRLIEREERVLPEVVVDGRVFLPAKRSS